MQAIEALKTEKGEKERELQQLTETSGASGHQKLRVCDVCGAYLSVLDSDRRLADHFGGKVQSAFFFLPSPSLLGTPCASSRIPYSNFAASRPSHG